MPRLRNTRTGVVVSVDDATAAHLGRAYEDVQDQPAGGKSSARPATTTQRRSRKSTDDE